MVVINKHSYAMNDLGGSPRKFDLVRSVFFGVGFSLAVFLLVVSSLYAVSDEPESKARVLYILIANLALIVVLGGFLALQVIRRLFVKSTVQLAPLLHRRFV